jgi:signal transduction histidine kinase
VAEETSRLIPGDRFFWLIFSGKGEVWVSEIYRKSGLPAEARMHLHPQEAGCTATLIDAIRLSRESHCDRFPDFRQSGFSVAGGPDRYCPFSRAGAGDEILGCLRQILRRAGFLASEEGSLIAGPVLMSETSLGILCMHSDLLGAFSREDACFICLAASSVGYIWRAADAASSIRRLKSARESVSDLAHDFKAPLQRLARELSALSEDREGEGTELGELAGEADRLLNLTREMIDISNPAGRSAQFIDVAELIDESTSLVSGELSRMSVMLSRSVSDSLPPILANREDVDKVIRNILSNCVTAAGNGGSVSVSAYRSRRNGSETVEVDFRDSGDGVPEGDLERVFEPFYTTTTGGSGLGLTSARRRARANGGDVVCESGDDGKSRFVAWFPIAVG